MQHELFLSAGLVLVKYSKMNTAKGHPTDLSMTYKPFSDRKAMLPAQYMLILHFWIRTKEMKMIPFQLKSEEISI
jgi:hypothetical protein